MLRRIVGCILAAVALLVGSNAFRQVPNEFRDTEPGSMLFGVLQLIIGTSTVVAAVGLVLHARWASRAIGIGGIAAAGLLAAQPFFTPMPRDAQWSIWFGAAVVGVAAAGMSWCARRLARPTAASGTSDRPASLEPPAPSPALLPDARFAVDAMLAPMPVSRVAQTARTSDRPPASGVPMPE